MAYPLKVNTFRFEFFPCQPKYNNRVPMGDLRRFSKCSFHFVVRRSGEPFYGQQSQCFSPCNDLASFSLLFLDKSLPQQFVQGFSYGSSRCFEFFTNFVFRRQVTINWIDACLNPFLYIFLNLCIFFGRFQFICLRMHLNFISVNIYFISNSLTFLLLFFPDQTLLSSPNLVAHLNHRCYWAMSRQ